MKKELFKTSQSKARTWRTCHQQFWYRHVLGLQRRRRPRPFAFGTIVHKMKENVAAEKDPFEVLRKLPAKDIQLFREEREVYGDIVMDIQYIFAAYMYYWQKEPLVYVPHKKRLTEHPFELEYKDLLIKGTIDAVTRHRKMDWLTEHKNHKVIPNADERWRSMQSVVYIRVAQMLGWWKIEGTCWDYIRTKSPTRPQLLKSGEVSERALDSLPNVVVDTLKSFGKNPVHYKPLLDTQRLNLTTWFQRVYTPIKKQALDRIWSDFISTSQEMSNANLDKPQVRTIGRHCSWCEFEPLCRTYLEGGDEEFVRDREYEPSSYDRGEEETE